MTISSEQIFSRQMDLFNPDEHQTPITILGAGATGSFTALALAKMGVKDIEIWDSDFVEMHNCPNQLHRWSDLGRPKVEATAEIIALFCNGLDNITPNVKTVPTFFLEDDEFDHGIVICAADSMGARKLFWEKIKNNFRISLYIDPRVGGQIFHLYCIDPMDPLNHDLYEKSLHSDEEASELPCGERATCDMSFLVASRICRAVRRFCSSSIIEPFIIEMAKDLQVINAVPTKEE